MIETNIKINDSFNADGVTWTVVGLEEGVSLQSGRNIIEVCTDGGVYVYKKFKNGRTTGIRWIFSWEEIKMVHEVVKTLEKEGYNIEISRETQEC